MNNPITPLYQSITIHPADKNGACEVWAEWIEDMDGLDTDGIIGWLYNVSGVWVWLNEAGHPTRVFSDAITTSLNLHAWLLLLSPNVIWATKART